MPGVWRITFSLPGADAAPPADVVFHNAWDAEHADIVYGARSRPQKK